MGRQRFMDAGAVLSSQRPDRLPWLAALPGRPRCQPTPQASDLRRRRGEAVAPFSNADARISCHVDRSRCRSTRGTRLRRVYFAHLGTGRFYTNSARSRTGPRLHLPAEVDDLPARPDGEENHLLLVEYLHRTAGWPSSKRLAGTWPFRLRRWSSCRGEVAVRRRRERYEFAFGAQR